MNERPTRDPTSATTTAGDVPTMSTRFAYFYLMADDPDRVRSVAPRHTEHWHKLNFSEYRGGPFGDRSGGLITFVVDEPTQAEVAIAGDPFVREGLLEHYWLKPWDPVHRDSRT
jgi:uncharacterized protein YciI